MSLSKLLVVQPLLDAGGHAVSGAAGKKQGNDAGTFQSMLKGEIANRQQETPFLQKSPDAKADGMAKPSSVSNETKPAGPAKPAENASIAEKTDAADKDSDTASLPGMPAGVEEDATVLAQILSSVAGTQILPVEPRPVNTEVAEDIDMLARLGDPDVDAGSGRKLVASSDSVKEMMDGGEDVADEALFSNAKADAGREVKTAVEKPAVDAAQARMADTVAGRPVAEQPVQAQQPVTQTQAQVLAGVQVQQAQGVQVAAQVDPASNRIMQQLGSPAWNQAIGQRVLWMVGQEQQSASLILNPPELGPVRVVVNVSNNSASANFFSAHPDVRQALEGSLPRLREMLEGAGIQLGQAQVGAETSDNQQAAYSGGTGSRATGVAGDSDDGLTGNVPLSGTKVTTGTISRGMVDTFV